MNESALKSKLTAILSKDFVMHSEIDGVSLVDGCHVKADFLVRPKKDLVDRRFRDEWFGVEVKEIDFEKHPSRKLYGTFWQAVCYSQAKFAIGAESIRPSFCVLYIGSYARRPTSPSDEAQKRRWDILMELGVYANTGFVTGESADDWIIWFGQGSYFKKVSGLNTIPRGLKRYTGNINTMR